jgi:hypothetical protein
MKRLAANSRDSACEAEGWIAAQKKAYDQHGQ